MTYFSFVTKHPVIERLILLHVSIHRDSTMFRVTQGKHESVHVLLDPMQLRGHQYACQRAGRPTNAVALGLRDRELSDGTTLDMGAYSSNLYQT